MSDLTFNLVDKPWIRSRLHSGELVTFSLRETYARSKHIQQLAGEIPTQDVAILRVLLAILLAATRSDRRLHSAEAMELWESWWQEGSVPNAVNDYLQRHHDRFDLLDTKAPFMQVADLRTRSGNTSGLHKLIAEIPDSNDYFTTRAAGALEPLSFAEAARWLIHCHAYDPSGIKTGAEGDTRTKGGKGYPMGYPAWAGTLGIAYAEGSNLFETLLLNLPLELTSPADLPIWERQPLGPGVESDHPLPKGPTDAFTWPSRRIRLLTASECVVDCQISNGDRLEPKNLFTVEPMTAWRESTNQSKAAGRTIYMPTVHRESQRLWQGLGSLLQSSTAAQKGTKRLAALDWITRLIDDEVLPREYPVRLRTAGILYGPKAASIAGSVADSLTAHANALTDPTLVALAIDAAHSAQQGVIALVNLQSNLERARGGEGSAGREVAFELGYAVLDAPYRQWLTHVITPDQLGDYRVQWHMTAAELLRKTGRKLISQVGPEAWIGRNPTEDTNGRIDCGLAEIWFLSSLNKTFGSQYTPRQETTS